MGLVVLLDRQRKPADKNELMLWCRTTAEANGTQVGGGDMRTYMGLLCGRIEKQFGVKIEEQATQQLSKQRSAVNVSSIREFTVMVSEVLQAKPHWPHTGATRSLHNQPRLWLRQLRHCYRLRCAHACSIILH